jgi:hypothetical protein
LLAPRQQIPGLPAACLAAIVKPPSDPGELKQRNRLYDSDIYEMGQALPKASNTQRVLLWEAITSNQHRIDLVYLTWKEVREARESLRLARRRKTGASYSHYLGPELMDSLDDQEQEAGDIYVCKEVVFTKHERLQPGCNKTKLSPAEELRRAGSVTGRATKQLDGFFNLAGVKRPGISFKAIRAYNASLGLSTNQSPRVLLDALGLKSLKSLMVYAYSTPGQVAALGEYFRRHWHAVMEGKTPRVISCLSEAVEVVTEEVGIVDAMCVAMWNRNARVTAAVTSLARTEGEDSRAR